VPLSEHEQRLFEQIERSLAEDPKFASAVRATTRDSTPTPAAGGRLLVVAGLALVVYGVASNSVPLAWREFV